MDIERNNFGDVRVSPDPPTPRRQRGQSGGHGRRRRGTRDAGRPGSPGVSPQRAEAVGVLPLRRSAGHIKSLDTAHRSTPEPLTNAAPTLWITAQKRIHTYASRSDGLRFPLPAGMLARSRPAGGYPEGNSPCTRSSCARPLGRRHRPCPPSGPRPHAGTWITSSMPPRCRPG